VNTPRDGAPFASSSATPLPSEFAHDCHSRIGFSSAPLLPSAPPPPSTWSPSAQNFASAALGLRRLSTSVPREVFLPLGLPPSVLCPASSQTSTLSRYISFRQEWLRVGLARIYCAREKREIHVLFKRPRCMRRCWSFPKAVIHCLER